MEPADIARRAARIGLKHTHLAKAADLNHNTIGRIFSGRHGGWRLTLLKIETALVAEERALLKHLLELHGPGQRGGAA